MGSLKSFQEYDIDWEMTPETAVTLYLEWGNNSWLGEFKPVRHRSDSTTYFVVNTWGTVPMVSLVKRTTDDARELVEMPLPEHLRPKFMNEVGCNKGVYAPTPEIKSWLRQELNG